MSNVGTILLFYLMNIFLFSFSVRVLFNNIQSEKFDINPMIGVCLIFFGKKTEN